MHEIRRTMRDSERSRVIVTLRLSVQHGERQTVTHATVPAALRVSFIGDVIAYRHREPYACGQVSDYVPDARLRAAWERWHLNDLQSHCAHQDRAVRWDVCPPCPESGYRAGSAWLLEPVTVSGAVECLAAMHGDGFVIGRDGIAVDVVATASDAVATVHKLQGQSLSWALEHEGWSVARVIAGQVAELRPDYTYGEVREA